MPGRQAVIVALVFLLGLQAPVALGQASPSPSPLEQAKDQFRRGVTLLNAGDTEGALEDFLRSRELRPSGKNTVNAAICLERLGRYDEAFELYEEVVARFATELDPVDRENLVPVMASLQKKIGYLELSANVDGAVIVGGRPRGRLPFRTALRVLPGQLTVRILKDGYLPFETSVEVNTGETRRLDARLERVAISAPAPLSGLPAETASARTVTPFKLRRWQLELGASLGGIYSARTRAGLESSCPDFCARDRGVLGGLGALTFGLRHASGLGVEVAGGYALFQQKLSRAAFDGDVTYALDQTLTAKGFTAAIRARFDRRIGPSWYFLSSGGVGLWFADFKAEVSGVAWTTDAATTVSAAATLPTPTPGTASETLPFTSLALGLQYRSGRAAFGLDLGALFFPAVGRNLKGPVLGTGPACTATTSNAVRCSSTAVAGERAHGAFWLATPELAVRYAL